MPRTFSGSIHHTATLPSGKGNWKGFCRTSWLYLSCVGAHVVPEHASKRLVLRCNIRVPRPAHTDCILQMSLHVRTYRRDLHTGVRAQLMTSTNLEQERTVQRQRDNETAGYRAKVLTTWMVHRTLLLSKLPT